ncbi:hypothetical protein ACHAWO_002967 [Cyclotella atomus]|uniref:Uncharacterized protein n=1 Tax=Cyclotella atomus TaxID=382360 RepID=A0ABD3MZS4_9STRA
MTRIATAILSALLTTAIPTTVQAGNVDNGDYAINYWTNYAIYPLRCVNYNSQDQIMFSMYEKSYNHCSDSPMGTYVTSVENYINGYIQQMEANAMDGGSEYTYPDMADYVNCTYGEINGAGYYMQVGCNPNSPVGLSVNVYSDEACSSPVSSSIDTSSVPNDLSLNYKKCTPCVIWMDKNDDEIDDGYYENKQQNAPLCNAAWNYKAICDGKCQAMAREQKVREGWNKADKVLLTVLSLFGFGMLLTIIKKRQKMSNKDTLLEQAAISAAGLQQTHILGIFALLILIIVMFALLGLKKITWALLLLLNIVLFAYLMKLTVDGSMKETIIGPDGKIIENDDSEDEEDDEEEVVSPTSAENGAYENPNLPTLS